MHLSYKTSKYKDKIYKSYFIAESYRDGKKVKKHIIWQLGKLTEEQAQQIRFICQAISDKTKVLTTLENIVVEKSKPFLDIAVANALWEEWDFSKAFRKHNSNSELSTSVIARILTINRCIYPCSHYSIPHWAETTATAEIINYRLDKLNEDKIYYELDKIALCQEDIENHLFKITYRKDRSSYDFVNYDLSTSYFVGIKCKLSAYGVSKDDKPRNKQVLLGIMVNQRGYPFKWDVYPGNVAEVETLVDNVNACSQRFNLRNVTLVFDRGIVSEDNLNYIDDKKLKYVTALDKDQIYNIAKTELEVFNNLTLDNYMKHLIEQQFKCYDDLLYFKELKVTNKRRYILGFNHVLFSEERKCRSEKIQYFEKFLAKKNKELKEAKRLRKLEPTKQSIINELKRLKITKYFQDLVLKKISIKLTNKKGEKRTVKSFELSVDKKNEKIAHSEKLDGVCVFVSNHWESFGKDFLISSEKIIKAYREKVKIEDAFKHIKSFLKIRPFYVNTDEHVRAVYSVCVLAYFLNKDLAERRKKAEGIDYLNSKNLYEPFRDCNYVTIKDKASQRKKSEPVELTVRQKNLLGKLNIKKKILNIKM